MTLDPVKGKLGNSLGLCPHLPEGSMAWKAVGKSDKAQWNLDLREPIYFYIFLLVSICFFLFLFISIYFSSQFIINRLFGQFVLVALVTKAGAKVLLVYFPRNCIRKVCCRCMVFEKFSPRKIHPEVAFRLRNPIPPGRLNKGKTNSPQYINVIS